MNILYEGNKYFEGCAYKQEACDGWAQTKLLLLCGCSALFSH